jgi:hypothetical protein
MPQTATIRASPARVRSLLLTAAVGVSTNFSRVVSPAPLIEVGYFLPIAAWPEHLALVARVSYQYARLTTAADASATAVEHAVPLSVCARYVHRLAPLTLAATVGPAVAITYAEARLGTERTATTQTVFGLDAGVGVERALGPGALVLDVSYRWLRRDSGGFGLDAGGLLIAGGYRLLL